MNRKILRVAIAGFGVVGKRRRKYIDLHPAMETIAVCDKKFDKAGIFEDGVAYCQSAEELLARDFDVLFVCLTNDVAPDVTIAGLKKGVHVFCEKPPGRNVQDIERVIEVEKTHPNQRLKYGFNHRYHDSVRDALEITRSGELGRVLNLRGVYGKSKFISYGEHSAWRTQRDVAGGGILLDQGIHLVDLMRLFGGEFTHVNSFISNDFWKYDIEDNAYALMKTDDNVVGMLHSSATQWRHRFSLEVAMEKGAIILSGILSGSKSYGAETLTKIWVGADDRGDPMEQTTRYNNDPSWEGEINEFADAIINGGSIEEGSSLDALKTMQLVFDIYRADPEWRDKWGL
ncbi:MAG: Gfo/Idh/MocA family oxidoreductase [Magnetovibrio sp.]|nr:Gfo/Idh/MocA family oxidoreductase [Magnetovibrio sp.]